MTRHLVPRLLLLRCVTLPLRPLQRVRKLKKKQQRAQETEESAKKRVRAQLEADEPRDDGGGGGKRKKISFDEPHEQAASKNPKQREPSAADIAKAQAMMPVIKMSQVR